MVPLLFLVVALLTGSQLTEGAKFIVCGRKSGVVTTARSAALGSRIFQKCGRRFILNEAGNTTDILQIIEKTCVLTHLCYARSQYIKANITAFRRTTRECLVKGGLLLHKLTPNIFGILPKTVESFILQGKDVIADDESLEQMKIASLR